MPNPKTVEVLRGKYLSLVEDLDERGRRRWAATEAMAIGHGGIVAVAAATGLSGPIEAKLQPGLIEAKLQRGAISLKYLPDKGSGFHFFKP